MERSRSVGAADHRYPEHRAPADVPGPWWCLPAGSATARAWREDGPERLRNMPHGSGSRAGSAVLMSHGEC